MTKTPRDASIVPPSSVSNANHPTTRILPQRVVIRRYLNRHLVIQWRTLWFNRSFASHHHLPIPKASGNARHPPNHLLLIAIARLLRADQLALVHLSPMSIRNARSNASVNSPNESACGKLNRNRWEKSQKLIRRLNIRSSCQ